MRARPILVGGVLAIVTAAPRADACWCGYTGQVGNVTLVQAMPNADYCPVSWTPEIVKSWATWLTRIDALAPGGVTAKNPGDRAVVHGVGEVEWGDPESLFHTIAPHVAASRVARARARSRDVFTIQLFASTTEAAADAIAERVERSPPRDVGFFSAGGHPATIPVAHVVTERVSGRELHRVWVGAYLDRRAGAAAAAEIRKLTGLRGFVRRM